MSWPMLSNSSTLIDTVPLSSLLPDWRNAPNLKDCFYLPLQLKVFSCLSVPALNLEPLKRLPTPLPSNLLTSFANSSAFWSKLFISCCVWSATELSPTVFSFRNRFWQLPPSSSSLNSGISSCAICLWNSISSRCIRFSSSKDYTLMRRSKIVLSCCYVITECPCCAFANCWRRCYICDMCCFC